MDAFDDTQLTRLLGALSERLALGGRRVDLVVIGGAALTILGLVDRTTRDIDLVALLDGGVLVSAKPLPPELIDARDAVAVDFGISDGWLNSGPADLFDFGLPDGFLGRLDRRDFGPALTAHFASRVDQIHFKLYALVDQGLGRHEVDLRALAPTRDELAAAARWTRTHDSSEGFREMLEACLLYLGVDDVDVGP